MTRMILPVFMTFLLASARPASAQDAAPPVELFGAYSFLPANGDDFPRQSSHGIQIGVTANLNRWFGLSAEFGEQRDTTRHADPNFAGLVSKSTVREYLVGPRFTARGTRTSVFAQGWFGRATGTVTGSFSGFSDSAVAVGGGAGVDVAVTPRLAIRGQFDVLGSFTDILEANSRLALGVVWRVGGR